MHWLYDYCSQKELCFSRLFTTCGHLSLNIMCAAPQRSWNQNDPLLCSCRARQLSESCLQESLYLSMWQFNFPQTSKGMWETQFVQEKEKKRTIYLSQQTAVLIIHFKGIASKCNFFSVCFVYFRVSRLWAKLLLRMNREMTAPGLH